MKKLYICPITKVVEIDTEQIIAASPSFADGEVNSGDAKELFFDLSEDDLY